jgi:hypothetical protein
MPAQPAEPTPTPRRTAVAHAWLTSPEYQQLQFQADRRGEHPDQLAAMILKSVLLNGYVDAVLADL